MKACAVDWCDSPSRSRGWCNRHYLRFRKYGDAEAVGAVRGLSREQAFYEYARIRETDECIEWNSTRTKKGYGKFHSGGRGSHPELAHRASFAIHIRPLDEGEHVRHKCDNPPCVNPRHLLAGSNADNVADRVERGRQTRGEDHWPAILTEREVLEIRERRSAGERLEYLGQAYGVSSGAVSAIVHRRSWRHI